MADLKKKPNTTVKSVTTPKRGSSGSYQFSSDVNLGDSLVSTNNEARATNMYFGWTLNVTVPSGTSTAGLQTRSSGSQSISSSSKKFTKTKNVVTMNGYTRNSWYPYTGIMITGVTFWAQPYNKFGEAKAISKTREIKKPKKPSIGDFSVTQNSGRVSVTITSDAGQDYHERARTRYQVIVHNTRAKATWTQTDGSFSGTSSTVSYDPPDYQQLTAAQYIQITVKAWNQGLAGDSATVEKSYYMSRPATTTIKDVSCSTRGQTGVCTVFINTNKTDRHPVDSVELEYLADTTYKTASAIPATTWSQSGAVDDGRCNALSMSTANLIPSAGHYTWVRVKSTHAVSPTLDMYSAPMRVVDLETPAATASDDEIKILGEPTLGEDGESIVVHLGWNVDGSDDSTGTELSWADAEDAWRSTEPPDTFEFTWSDGSYTDTSGTTSVTYRDSATITIKKLELGQMVYVRARRYLDNEDGRTYGAYCNTKCQMPSSAEEAEPESVTLSLPGFVAEGGSALASWTLGSTKQQTMWRLLTGGDKVIEANSGIANSYQIPYDRLASLAENNTLDVRVSVSTGGGWITSDARTLVIVAAPTLSLTVPSSGTLTALSNATFTLASNKAVRIVASIVANGIGGQSAAGIIDQYEGDVVWSYDGDPLWTKNSNTSYSVSIPFTDCKSLKDGSTYTIAVQAVDDSTGLKSPEATGNFTVAWSHQAVAPEGCTVTPSDTIDADGVRTIKATLVTVAPSGASSSDRYDIYRMTGDGATLIGGGYPSGKTLVDEYAPYGSGMDLFYRFVMRTADGDEQLADIHYALNVGVLRFDWPYGSLELPYNIEVGDGYKKFTQQRLHLDGVNNVYWNNGVTRTAKYTSQLVRLSSQEQVSAARQLARYPGSVFVRTPDGSAFEADVQITDMSTNYPLETFSISVTEVSPSGLYDLPPNETD